MSETERELHAEFFTQWDKDEIILITDMSDEQLTERRNAMGRIALEAKVRTTRDDEEIRQRRAKKITAGKPWLVGSDTPNVGEMRKGIESRKERMSKEDKILAMMKDLGVEGAENIIKKVTDDKIKNFKIVRATPASDVKLTEPKNDEPFDFTKLGD